MPNVDQASLSDLDGLVATIAQIADRLFEASWHPSGLIRADWARWVIYTRLMKAIQPYHQCLGELCWCQGAVFQDPQKQEADRA